MSSVADLLAWGVAQLDGYRESRSEAGALLAHALGRDRSWLFAWPEAQIEERQADNYRDLIVRRAQGEPLAYLTGTREFWSLTLGVDRHTLIPRPETEDLLEFVLARLADTPGVRAIDLGTGSGAIALALASERPGWRITATDRSIPALLRARRNAREHNLRIQFTQADWLQGIRGPFELIVSNPPYIASGDEHLRQDGLDYEPREALVSGEDGLQDIRRIVATARECLAPGGWLAFEHGFDQGAASRLLLAKHGYHDIGTGRDLAGRERFSFARG